MSVDDEDPHCPECGEPIGQTATYCMHCSADLTEARERADADGDGVWDEAESDADSADDHSPTTQEGVGPTPDNPLESSEQLLDPDGTVDNTLTAVVGIVGGLIVSIVGMLVFALVIGGTVLFPLWVVAWLGVTAYLVNQRTVQAAVAKSGYAVAGVLLLAPLLALSPFMNVDGGIVGRGKVLVILLFFFAVPAGIAAVVGWVASRFVPEDAGSAE